MDEIIHIHYGTTTVFPPRISIHPLIRICNVNDERDCSVVKVTLGHYHLCDLVLLQHIDYDQKQVAI